MFRVVLVRIQRRAGEQESDREWHRKSERELVLEQQSSIGGFLLAGDGDCKVLLFGSAVVNVMLLERRKAPLDNLPLTESLMTSPSQRSKCTL